MTSRNPMGVRWEPHTADEADPQNPLAGDARIGEWK